LARLEPQFERFDAFRTTPLMSLDEVRQVATVHEVGAHSFEHATMPAESDEYFTIDLARCQDWFVHNFGKKSDVYAFPNGAAKAGQAKLARAAGFSTVLLVDEKFSHCRNWLHPRFTMYAKSRAEARFRALGGLRQPSVGGGGDERE